MVADFSRVFIGSHNLTRGGLTYNLEMTCYTETVSIVRDAEEFMDEVWDICTPIDQLGPLPPEPPPVEITLGTVQIDGAFINLTFTANHTEDADAFAAVCGRTPQLLGAHIGPTVPPTATAASIIPNADPVEVVCVAIRAFRDGRDVATSITHQLTYAPTAPPPEETYGEAEAGFDALPPPPLTAPGLASVQAASESIEDPDSIGTVTITWAFPGIADFVKFVIEQRGLDGVWNQVTVIRDPAIRTWTGAPDSLNPAMPFRIVVHDLAGLTEASNEMGIG